MLFRVAVNHCSPGILRAGKLFGFLLMVLCLLGALAACDPTEQIAPSSPTPVAAWEPPTPFPPMDYPTDTPASDLVSDAGDGSILGAGNASLKADQLGKIQQ